MARPLRFQYPGAVYHVMARGDGGKVVFQTDDDRLVFLKRLEETCGSCGWRVHAWVLMGNHFHLLIETPQPNLVAGMKWLLGVFSQGWNRARERQGHVFQGRYKSVIDEYAPELGLPTEAAELARLRKGDKRKAMMAALLRRRTTVGFEGLAAWLQMGHSGSVSRLVCGVKRDRKLAKRINELEKLFQ